MAAALKHQLGPAAVGWLAQSLRSAWAPFDADAFTTQCRDGLESLELKQRAHHIARALARHLPARFPEAAEIIARALGPEVEPTGETGMEVLRYLPYDCFIESCGLDDPEAAFALQEELTKRSSCEFSIRAFLGRHPERTYAQLEAWAASPNAHLRRLASEGSRPRLPWAARLSQFQKDPAPVAALLERLKDDPVRYVQRSVANSVNDIAKDHPELAVALCRAWLADATAGRRWIINHALRTLLRQGHSGALELVGAGASAKVRLASSRLTPARPRIGERLQTTFTIESTARSAQRLVVTMRIHYVKANGQTRPKVFKLGRLTLAGGGRAELRTSLSLADMTTRRHYPGRHRLELMVNGRAHPAGEFQLRPS